MFVSCLAQRNADKVSNYQMLTADDTVNQFDRKPTLEPCYSKVMYVYRIYHRMFLNYYRVL